MTDNGAPERRQLRIEFRTSIVTLFVAVVLFVGLTLVHLSFSRVSQITQTAASTFIDKVTLLGADRVAASKFSQAFRRFNRRESRQFAALRLDGLDAAQQSADIQSLCRL